MKFLKLLLVAGVLGLFILPFFVSAQGVNLWFLSSGNVRPNVSTWGLQVNALGSGGSPCVVVSATGVFSTSTCLTVAVATTTINVGIATATGPAFVFATSTAATTWNITASGGALTFTIPSSNSFFTNGSGFTRYASSGPWTAGITVDPTQNLTFGIATGTSATSTFGVGNASTTKLEFVNASGTRLDLSGVGTFATSTYFPGSGAWLGSGNVGFGTTTPSGFVHVIGQQPASVGSGNGTNATEVLTVTGGVGGNTTDTASANGGTGSTINIISGAGGTADSVTGITATGGNGGNATFKSGAGAANSASATNSVGGAGGTASLTSGNGGAASNGSTSNTGGTGGTASLTAGSGGNVSAANGTAGTGGGVSLNAGGGGTNAIGNAGAGGSITALAGVGRNGVKGGNGGAISFTARNGGTGTTDVGGNGGAWTVAAGNGGNSSGGGNGGSAGNINLTAGNGATGATNSNGGSLYFLPGSATAPASSGIISFGCNSAATCRGNIGILTTFPSSTLHVIGDGIFTTNLDVRGVSSSTEIRAPSSTIGTTYLSTLDASGAVNASSTLTVQNNAVLRGTLNVTGTQNNSSTLTIQGNFEARGTAKNIQGDNFSTSTAQSLAGTYLGVSGATLTVSSTIASSSISLNPTEGSPTSTRVYLASRMTISFIQCVGSNAAQAIGLTRQDNIIQTTSSATIVASISCPTTGTSTTAFTSSTLPAGTWLRATTTAWTASSTEIFISLTKQ